MGSEPREWSLRRKSCLCHLYLRVNGASQRGLYCSPQYSGAGRLVAATFHARRCARDGGRDLHLLRPLYLRVLCSLELWGNRVSGREWIASAGRGCARTEYTAQYGALSDGRASTYYASPLFDPCHHLLWRNVAAPSGRAAL